VGFNIPGQFQHHTSTQKTEKNIKMVVGEKADPVVTRLVEQDKVPW
jgi:hypothetical protein